MMGRSTLPAPLSPSGGSSGADGAGTPGAAVLPRSPLVAGRFEVLALIGVGGMGSVYRARDVTLDEMVALKVISREIAGEPGMLERFRREVKLARRVTHPNVARCFDIGQDGDDCFFTMELIEGESLGERLAREGRLTSETAIAVALDVCAGLAAAHHAGVVHRDLKPDNVLVASNGRIVLTDFGIASARLPTDGASRTVGIIVGTPEYMAPEQVEGVRDIDGRADIYALGAMVFELVTGTSAWTGPTALAIVAARLALDPPDPRGVVPLGDGLAKLILRCMARRREDRFPDIEAVATALRALVVAPTPQPSPSGLVVPPAAPSVAARAGAELRQPSSPPHARAALREKSVMVFARADEDDELARAVAEGLGDLVERHLRGSSALRVVAGENVWGTRTPDGACPPAAEVARRHSATLVLDTTVALAGESVAVDVDLVNVVDGVVLCTRQHTAPRAELFGIAATVARDVAEMLRAGHSPTLPGKISDARSLDLWLRAGVEARSDAPFATDRAVALFEHAMERTPEDVWILAGYAALLVERFREAETPSADLVEALGMAERVIATTEVLGEAWLARATARYELGDPRGAVTDGARAGRIMPAYARVHALKGGALLEAGAGERARRQLSRAAELDARLLAPRLDLALAAAMEGAFPDANALIDDVLDRQPSPDAWLVAARLALWSNDAPRARALREGLARRPVERAERALHVLEAAASGGSDEAIAFFGWLAEGDPVAARRSAAARKIEAELAVASGDPARAIEAIEAAAATAGFFDVAWLDGCPLLRVLRRAPRFVELRAQVRANGRDVLEILELTQEES